MDRFHCRDPAGSRCREVWVDRVMDDPPVAEGAEAVSAAAADSGVAADSAEAEDADDGAAAADASNNPGGRTKAGPRNIVPSSRRD